jgi:hypothetical protein
MNFLGHVRFELGKLIQVENWTNGTLPVSRGQLTRLSEMEQDEDKGIE